MLITYHFQFGDLSEVQISVDTERVPRPPSTVHEEQLPEWTRLDVHQCPHCPLAPAMSAHCPAAADLAPTVGRFGQIISYDQARVTVTLYGRTIKKTGPVQDALSSLMGLIMASSTCPVLGRMRGLTRTHLPFATHEETLLRMVGAYLIRQVINGNHVAASANPLEALKAHYADLEQLDRSFRLRLRSAARQDAILNAMSLLGATAMGVGLSIEDQLAELDAFVFDPGFERYSALGSS